MEKSFYIENQDLKKQLKSFSAKGITEFVLQDNQILSHKGKLLQFLEAVKQEIPELFVILPVSAQILDMDVCRAVSELYCSLEIPLIGENKGDAFLFDKKFYSRRSQMLNNLGLIFGFNMDFACVKGDSVKSFRDRLDFAISLYPNHIDFPQLEKENGIVAKNSALFSSQDIKRTSATAFACSSFYSFGRAVPWFLSVIKPLKISPSRFFEDFSEWQKVNNCGYDSGWNYSTAKHLEIEKMQLCFLKFKYDEKNKIQIFDVVHDIVILNGALSRCVGENEESTIELFYNPEDLLSGESQNISSFADNVMLEHCKVHVFNGEEGPTYKIIG